MITEAQFIKAIEDIGNQYEAIKDMVYSKCDTLDAMDINEQLAKFRDIACIALRESHTTQNFNNN